MPAPLPTPSFKAPKIIFWAGLLVRVLYISLAHTYRIRLLQDHFQFGWEMGRIARALATGYGFADPFNGHSGPTAWVPPLYPVILAGVFKLFGVYTPLSAWVILTFNSIVSAATAPPIYEIAKRCYKDEKLALWSAWLWALYPAAMQYAVRWVWEMSLTTFLFACVLVVALRTRGIGSPPGQPRQTTIQWASFGVLWGLIALTNSSLLIFLPVSGIWMLWDLRSAPKTLAPALAKAALSAVLCGILIAPWIVRNWIVFHAFVPMRGNFGAELYESALLENQGFPWMATLPLAENAPDFQRYKRLGEIAYSKQQSERGRTIIRAHPDIFIHHTFKRIYFFWCSVPHPIEKSFLLELSRELAFSFTSLTGLLGLTLALRRSVPGAPLLAGAFITLPLIYYFITVQARFRHPLEPLIAIFTVYLFRSATRRKPVALPQL